MQRTSTGKAQTRIQREKTAQIHAAALSVFSAHGFHGATLDQIAQEAGMSKPNLLYYFPSKEAIHEALLQNLINMWLEPLHALNVVENVVEKAEEKVVGNVKENVLENTDAHAEPLDAIIAYVRRKLALSRDYPRESRLFANEILQGAPRIKPLLSGELKVLVQNKAQLIDGWIKAGKIRKVDPVHLIFSIWSLTQHYADFDAQIYAVLGDDKDPFPDAEAYLVTLFSRMLEP